LIKNYATFPTLKFISISIFSDIVDFYEAVEVLENKVKQKSNKKN